MATTRASDNAPAVGMSFNDNADGNIIMHDVMIPTNASHQNTYYMTLGWNAGQEGGGYCGIQDSGSRGHNTIFSIWNSQSVHQGVYDTHLGHGTSSGPFGGEGKGKRTINYGYGWAQNRWYTLVVRNWKYGNYTQFGLWIHDQSAQKWFHHATLGYPVPNIVFKGPTNCFIEDWARDGQYSRSVYYKDGFKRSTSNKWIPFTTGNYNAHGGTTHANNYDVRVSGSSFWLATGDSVAPTVAKQGTLTLNANYVSQQPRQPPIAFSITSATHTHASWHVPESSTPQFSYDIKIDGTSVSYGNGSEVRSVNFNHPGGRNIEVILEDILGRRTSHTHYVSRL